jgi:5-methylcytosine-specific restriction endonuclease McrA
VINNFAKIRDRDPKGRFIIPIQPSGFNLKEYVKKYYLLNKERIAKKATEWNRKNKDKRKIIKRKWFLANRGHKNFLNKVRIYREKGAGGKVTKKDADNLFEKHNKICYYCKVNKATSIDHIIPISRGGSNDINNLVPACISCNSKKGNKLLSEFKFS